MHGFDTPWPLFLLIIAGYMALSLFVLGAKKVYFEPYDEKKAEVPPASESKPST